MAELGSDIAGVWDVSPTLETVTGRRALAQAILRRLITPRGALIGNATYGYDVVALVGSTVPASVVEQRVLEQVMAEEEVLDARVDATMTESTGELSVTISVTDSDGPFALTLTVSSELTAQAFLDSYLFASNDGSASAVG